MKLQLVKAENLTPVFELIFFENFLFKRNKFENPINKVEINLEMLRKKSRVHLLMSKKMITTAEPNPILILKEIVRR